MRKKTYTAEEWEMFRKHSHPTNLIADAERLGRKHRNYDNPSNVNPYNPSDPCWQAWRKGWLERDTELKRKGK